MYVKYSMHVIPTDLKGEKSQVGKMWSGATGFGYYC